MKIFAALFFATLLGAQIPAEQEAQELSRAIAEAGTSPIDFTRALEGHLRKYPETPQRNAIEKALAKSAIESNDRARIILYGERVLTAEPANDDLQLIDRVTRALLETDDSGSAKKALAYATRYEREVEAMRSRAGQGHMSPGQWSEEVDKGKARALVFQARATGMMGNLEDAVKLARQSWEMYPGAEGAREAARWLAKLGRDTEAIDFYAAAFTMDDGRTTDADRAHDRERMGELFTKRNGSEKGLGDVILRAYDRTVAMKRDRLAKLKLQDPNAGAQEVLDYTLPAVNGGPSLALASLKGSTIVMDFWATWCGPCKAQHPMIENVKKHYSSAANVVFLSINADDDHAPVPAFVKEMEWKDAAWYDGGLSRMLNINSIPTVIVVNPEGKIASRMTGFIPEKFEEMLAERIEDSRKN